MAKNEKSGEKKAMPKLEPFIPQPTEAKSDKKKAEKKKVDVAETKKKEVKEKKNPEKKEKKKVAPNKIDDDEDVLEEED